MGRIIFTLAVLGVFLNLSVAQAASVLISYDVKGAPAADLLDQGQPIDRDHAFELSKKGVDLSLLDPPTSDIWRAEGGLPIVQAGESQGYPPQGAKVVYESGMASSQGLFRSRVKVGGQPFQLLLGLNGHGALSRNALLRKLGYPIPSPQYYSNITVQFESIAARTSFLNSLSDGTLTARTRWIVDLPEDIPEVTLQDAILEPGQIDIPMYHWGVIPATALKGRRAIRALIVPLVLLEIPESVNLYSYELGKIMNNQVLLTHPYAESFTETTIEDARWIARKIAQLTRQELAQIIEAGQYPEDVTALLIEKLVARRNHLVELFNITDFKDHRQRSLPYTSALSMGNVKGGKLGGSGTYPGYAARFTYGDPDAPLRKSELSRYLFINGTSGVLGSLAGRVNQYMQVRSESDVTRDRQQQEFANYITWAQQHPGAPYTQTIGAWGGPVGGFSVRASREVVSGTFYGSDANVQLVDNVGVSASLGLFGQLGGIPKLFSKLTMAPTLRANITVQRNYLHLRPVADMKTAMKVKWTELWMPHFINHLAKILDDESPDAEHGIEGGADAALRRFLDTFKEGEMIVVTDSVLLGARGTVDIPIPIIMNPALMQFNPAFGVGAGAYPTIFRRTTILRTADGIQVYLQNAQALELELEFNFNWWINVLKATHKDKYAMGRTKAYLLDKEVDTPQERRDLIAALKGLIRWNDSEVLEDEFKYYEIKHDMQIATDALKLLVLRAVHMKEEHHAVIAPPSHPEKKRTLFSIRDFVNKGINVYSFFGDIVSAATQGVVTVPAPPGPNPANSFLGSAVWRSVLTEAELSPDYRKDPITVIEHHYGGWILSKDQLMKILDHLQEKVASMTIDKKLIRESEFATTTQLQMYQILSTFIVYEKGMDQITSLLLQPSVKKVILDLVDIEGRESLEAWCRQPLQRAYSPSISTYEDGFPVKMGCVKPWMKKAFAMRKSLMQLRKQGGPPEDEIRWKNKILKYLEQHMELPKLMNWVKKDGYFFQIKVSGFRKNDENGDTEYVSDTLGTFRTKEGASPFRDFALKYGIMANELYANYLNIGY